MLRPVGPHEARVYWVRRAVIVGLIAVLIVVLVTVLSGGSSKKPAAKPTPTPTPTPQTSTPATNNAVLSCNLEVLKLVLSTDSDTYTSGESATLNGVITNPGTVPCTLDVTPLHETWTVTSGADKIWTTKGCSKSSSKGKPIRIKAGGTRTISVAWNGHRLDPGCTSGSAALPGEYVLRASLDGIKGQPAVFHVTS